MHVTAVCGCCASTQHNQRDNYQHSLVLQLLHRESFICCRIPQQNHPLFQLNLEYVRMVLTTCKFGSRISRMQCIANAKIHASSLVDDTHDRNWSELCSLTTPHHNTRRTDCAPARPALRAHSTPLDLLQDLDLHLR